MSRLRLFESHLIVSDLDRSIGFYREVVGLEVAHIARDRGAAFFWIGGRGQSMLGVWRGGEGPQHTSLHLAFGAPLADVLDAPRTLRAAGVMPLDFDGHPSDVVRTHLNPNEESSAGPTGGGRTRLIACDTVSRVADSTIRAPRG